MATHQLALMDKKESKKKNEKKKAPAFQFYAENFLNGTADMSAEEAGAYIRLLCHQWHKGSVPNDIKKLMHLTHAKKSSIQNIMYKFNTGEDGQLRNQRMEITRQEQKEFRERQKANGLLGGRPKAITQTEAKENPNHNPNHNPKKALLSSSSISTNVDIRQRYQDFENQILEDEALMDDIGIVSKHKVTAENLKIFSAHLSTKEPHNNISSYADHFKNWLKKSDGGKKDISNKKEFSRERRYA